MHRLVDEWMSITSVRSLCLCCATLDLDASGPPCDLSVVMRSQHCHSTAQIFEFAAELTPVQELADPTQQMPKV